jgi:hypothetical protein
MKRDAAPHQEEQRHQQNQKTIVESEINQRANHSGEWKRRK